MPGEYVQTLKKLYLNKFGQATNLESRYIWRLWISTATPGPAGRPLRGPAAGATHEKRTDDTLNLMHRRRSQ